MDPMARICPLVERDTDRPGLSLCPAFVIFVRGFSSVRLHFGSVGVVENVSRRFRCC